MTDAPARSTVTGTLCKGYSCVQMQHHRVTTPPRPLSTTHPNPAVQSCNRGSSRASLLEPILIASPAIGDKFITMLRLGVRKLIRYCRCVAKVLFRC